MTDQLHSNDVRDLWQSQPMEDRRMSLDELRDRSRRLERTIDRRNLREYIAGAVVLISFGYIAWKDQSLTVKVGAGLVMAAAVFITYHLHQHGAAQTMPAELALTSCVQFHRRELERQRDLLRSVWAWYLLPCVPGLIVMLAGVGVAAGDRWIRIGATAAAMLVGFLGVAELNRRVASRIQAKIDALERDR